MAKTCCRGKNARGEPCRAAAGAGGLCYFHANPDLARELGRIGGKTNGHFTGVDIEVPAQLTFEDMCEFTSKVIGAVVRGELQDRQARALADLLRVQRENLMSAALEQRMAKLERQAAHVFPRPQPERQKRTEVSGRCYADNHATAAIVAEPLSNTVNQPEESCNSPELAEPSDSINKKDKAAVSVDSEQVATAEAQTEGDPELSE